MKKKTAVVLAVLTAGALIGSCVLGNIGYHVFAKGEEDFRIDAESSIEKSLDQENIDSKEAEDEK